jgi:hypothetical protein
MCAARRLVTAVLEAGERKRGRERALLTAGFLAPDSGWQSPAAGSRPSVSQSVRKRT